MMGLLEAFTLNSQDIPLMYYTLQANVYIANV